MSPDQYVLGMLTCLFSGMAIGASIATIVLGRRR